MIYFWEIETFSLKLISKLINPGLSLQLNSLIKFSSFQLEYIILYFSVKSSF